MLLDKRSIHNFFKGEMLRIIRTTNNTHHDHQPRDFLQPSEELPSERDQRHLSASPFWTSAGVTYSDNSTLMHLPFHLVTMKDNRKTMVLLASVKSTYIFLTCVLVFINRVHAFSTSPESIRINKVLKKTHSRRQADQLIADGRVTVNNESVHSAGQRVIPYHDVIRLDGRVVEGWEELNHLNSDQQINQKANTAKSQVFEYIKYWKPIGVTCTTDQRIKDNIIDSLWYDGCNPKSRIFPVGRLDKDTSGIILMTSDGRLPNASLRGEYKHPKTYMVKSNRAVSEQDIQQLREGVVITTVAQRDGNRSKPLTAPTLPCKVRRVQSKYAQMQHLESRVLEITLVEGRNRQIRKMMEALDYRVLGLHRKRFMGITLDGLEGEGDWCYLSEEEMGIVRNVLEKAERAEAVDVMNNDE